MPKDPPDMPDDNHASTTATLPAVVEAVEPEVFTPAAGLPSVPALSPEQQEQFEDIFERYLRARAAKTVRALRDGVQLWMFFCTRRGDPWLPAAPKTVAAYLDYLGQEAGYERPSAKNTVVLSKGPASAATMSQMIWAISTLHRMAEQDDPTKAMLVTLAMAGYRKDKGVHQKQAAGLPAIGIDGIVSHLTVEIDYQEDRLADLAAQLQEPRTVRARNALQREVNKTHLSIARMLRDRALLLCLRDGMLRGNEARSLRVTDFHRHTDGKATVLLRRSKTDQEGQGREIGLTSRAADLIEAWLRVRQDYVAKATEKAIAAGTLNPGDKRAYADSFVSRLFVSLNSAGMTPLSVFSIGQILDQRARAAGIAPPRQIGAAAARFSAHSARVGMAQFYVKEGVSTAAIQQAGRWKSERMVQRYAAKQLATETAALTLLEARDKGGEDEKE